MFSSRVCCRNEIRGALARLRRVITIFILIPRCRIHFFYCWLMKFSNYSPVQIKYMSNESDRSTLSLTVINCWREIETYRVWSVENERERSYSFQKWWPVDRLNIIFTVSQSTWVIAALNNNRHKQRIFRLFLIIKPQRDRSDSRWLADILPAKNTHHHLWILHFRIARSEFIGLATFARCQLRFYNFEIHSTLASHPFVDGWAVSWWKFYTNWFTQ